MSGIKAKEMIVVELEPAPIGGHRIVVMAISGGKDSLGMWLKLWEQEIPNLVPVRFDGGWEEEWAGKEIRRVERVTGMKCHYLDHRGVFDEKLKERGWPAWNVRWCTGYKRDKLERFFSSVKRGQPGFEVVQAVGIAADEKKRKKKAGMKRRGIWLPLVDMGAKEADCLRTCAHYGCNWGGHYLRQGRMSCWCCPFQMLKGLRDLYEYFPEKWAKIKEMDKTARKGRKFNRSGKYLWQLERRFARESKNGILKRGEI